MRKLLYLPILLFLISCGGKGVEGQVGQIISIAAEENLEEVSNILLKVHTYFITISNTYITSVSKKPGQTIVLYHYCGLSRFF